MHALNEICCLQCRHLMQWTKEMLCWKYLLWCQLYPADCLLAGLWRLNSCRNHPAAAAAASAVGCSAITYSAALFVFTTAQTLLLGFLQKRLRRWEFSWAFSGLQYFSLSYPPLRLPNSSYRKYLQISGEGWKQKPGFRNRLLRMTCPSAAGTKSIVDRVAANPSKQISAEHWCSRGWVAKVGLQLHKVLVHGQESDVSLLIPCRVGKFPSIHLARFWRFSSVLACLSHLTFS